MPEIIMHDIKISLAIERRAETRRKIQVLTSAGMHEVDAAIYGKFALHQPNAELQIVPPPGVDPKTFPILAITHIASGMALQAWAMADANELILCLECLIANIETANLDWDFVAPGDIPEETEIIAGMIIEAYFFAYNNRRQKYCDCPECTERRARMN